MDNRNKQFFIKKMDGKGTWLSTTVENHGNLIPQR